MLSLFQRARDAVLGWERRGWFSFSLLIGDAAIAGWLLVAQRAFLGLPPPSSHTLGKFAAGTALLALAGRLHSFRHGRVRWLLAKATLLAPATTLLASVLHTTFPAALWLGATVALALVAFRACFFAARTTWPDQPLEAARWIFLGMAATVVMRQFYTTTAIGSGDAHWYAVMLADFVTQLRAGVFPVWAGQSEFAFNGAISPLRFAPWFQYAGGFIDLLTAHALGFVALKNAAVVLTALAGVASAYICLRLIGPRRPGIACLLAALWIASPGVLAPLFSGDQYMTFMATPFIPIALYGCWRVWARDDVRARIAIAAGLGGLWLSHTPIALWSTLLAIAACGAKACWQREWRDDTHRALITSLAFVTLGALPIFSVLAIDNQNQATAMGERALQEVTRCFPANFLPLDVRAGANPLFTYQTGWVPLGAFGVALLLLMVARPRGGWFFSLTVLAVALFVLPVPGFSAAFWLHAPDWFMSVNNVWPMQRLMGIWAALMVFTLAIVASDERIARRTWLTSLLLLMLAGGATWSAREADKLTSRPTTSDAASTALDFAPGNVSLTRYAWASFASAPSYFSHGYMEPLLENRLLDRATLAMLTANADRAAPLLRNDVVQETFPRLVQSGVLTAVQKAPDFYLLEPALNLAPHERFALRMEFFRPGRPGLLQVFDGKMRRQYLLPDSGAGLVHAGPPRAFGSFPTSSHVMPLQIQGDQPVAAHLQFVGSGALDEHSFPSPRFAFARFWLYRYTARDLAVQVESLVPYRARTETANAAWLETPRMWLTGYRATVNGETAEVRRSPDNLVMVALPAGANTVALAYVAPWWLSALFWLCALGWSGLIVTSVRGVLATARRFQVRT